MITASSYLRSVTSAAYRVDLSTVDKTVDLLMNTYRSERNVFVIGNGGSASNASHFAEDLSKQAIPEQCRKRFRVLSLVDNIAFITAIANDLSYERIFDVQLRQFASKGDVLVAISGSGNSPNIISGVKYARQFKMKVIGITGFDGGKLRKLSDVSVHVPCQDMCQSEAIHAIILHMIVDLLRARLLAME